MYISRIFITALLVFTLWECKTHGQNHDLWQINDRQDSRLPGNEAGVSIATDNKGNIYTLGTFDGGLIDFAPEIPGRLVHLCNPPFMFPDIYHTFLLKQDPEGKLVWVVQLIGGPQPLPYYDLPYRGQDPVHGVTDLAVNPQTQDIYLSGFFTGENVDLIWAYSTSTSCDDQVAQDSVSSSQNGTATDGFLLCLDGTDSGNGSFKWVNTAGNAGAKTYFRAVAFQTDYLHSSLEHGIVAIAGDQYDFNPNTDSRIVAGQFTTIDQSFVATPVDSNGDFVLGHGVDVAITYDVLQTTLQDPFTGLAIVGNVVNTEDCDVEGEPFDQVDCRHTQVLHTALETSGPNPKFDLRWLAIHENYSSWGTGIDVDQYQNLYITTTRLIDGNLGPLPDVTDLLEVARAGIYKYTNQNHDPNTLDKPNWNQGWDWEKELLPNQGVVAGSATADIVLDDLSNTYVTGYFQEDIDFDPGPAEVTLSNPGFPAMYLLKLDTQSGDYKSVKNSISVDNGLALGTGTSADVRLKFFGAYSGPEDDGPSTYVTGEFFHEVVFPGDLVRIATDSPGFASDAFMYRCTSESGLSQIGETGTITLNHQWKTVNLTKNYDDPVVIMGPGSDIGSQPFTFRVRNVTSSSFEVQVDEWNYLDPGGHVQETASFLVVESGSHLLADGNRISAGHAALQDDDFLDISFPSSFASAPAIFSQTVTYNGPDCVTTRHRNVSVTGFEVRLQEEEAGNQVHVEETVDWIAMELATGDSAGQLYESGVTPSAVTHADYGLNFGQNFESTPSFIAAMQTTNGSDPGVIRYVSLDGQSTTIYVDEETSGDSETNHNAAESIGYIAIDEGAIFGTTIGQ